MKAVILSTPRYRQQMTLEITRREGEEEALFEIERCHAIGWVLGERPVDAIWEDEFCSFRFFRGFKNP